MASFKVRIHLTSIVFNIWYWPILQNYCWISSFGCGQVYVYRCPYLLNWNRDSQHGLNLPSVRYLQLTRWVFQNFMDYVEIGLEGLVAVMTAFYLLQELVEIAVRRLKYLNSFWNLLELLVIILLGVTSYLKVKDALKMQELLADPISITSPKLQNLSFWVDQENNLLGVITLLLW